MVVHQTSQAPAQIVIGICEYQSHMRVSFHRRKVQLLTRHGIEDEEAFKPQPFSLMITIADPQKKMRVYDEMAQIVRNHWLNLFEEKGIW